MHLERKQEFAPTPHDAGSKDEQALFSRSVDTGVQSEARVVDSITTHSTAKRFNGVMNDRDDNNSYCLENSVFIYQLLLHTSS